MSDCDVDRDPADALVAAGLEDPPDEEPLELDGEPPPPMLGALGVPPEDAAGFIWLAIVGGVVSAGGAEAPLV
jgi:hypothetical protein